MNTLAAEQRATVERAHAALTRSHEMNIGAASEGDLCRNIGRLEIALEQALRVIKETTGGQS